ncbi:MAG: G5 domain-containing protein [Candidatus Moraniibacteriota bacterium]
MKKLFFFFLVGFLIWYGWGLLNLTKHDPRDAFPQTAKSVVVAVNGAEFSFTGVALETVGAFLEKQGFPVDEHESVFPARSERLFSGTHILFDPARSMRLFVDGKDETFSTSARTTAEILSERGLTLDEDDLVEPLREESVPSKTKIIVTRVEIKEEFKDIPIAFTTKTEEDEKLSWRKTVVRQKGEKGTKRTTYRVAYHNGKEVNRRVLKMETLKEPVEEIVTQGTYIKVGKSHRGAASWYAWTGTMAAANPWLPLGSYVRVTNMENGKNVIVVINDRGPFVPGRIIDLDKVAFQKIASTGAGVINVKMEEIAN